MSELQTKFPTDTWVVASWDEYIHTIKNPAYEKAKCYYHNGQLRIEMTPLGHDHASDHTVIIFAINLFAALKSIPLHGLDNCTYRKTDFNDAQPDVSYYIGESADVIPWGTSIIDLNTYSPPNLAIEIANSSLADHKGEKRLLYEDLKVDEYWIVDVKKVQMIAFAVENGGSQRISESQVLPGLAISLVQEALQRTRQMNQAQVCAWLLAQFQQ